LAAPKRSKAQREYDLKEISGFYLQGWYQNDIVDYIAKNRPYRITRQVVARDLKTIQERWLASSLVDFDSARAESLAKIDELERVAWGEFMASKEPVIKRKTAKKVDGQTTEATQEVTLGTGDPRFFETIKWCIERRIKIFGLDAPMKKEISGKDGGPISTVDMTALSDDQLLKIVAGENVADVISE
jgi:hypothetical protein